MVSLGILSDVKFGNVLCVIVDIEPASPDELYGVTMYIYEVFTFNPVSV